jgi:hypothetical protein
MAGGNIIKGINGTVETRAEKRTIFIRLQTKDTIETLSSSSSATMFRCTASKSWMLYKKRSSKFVIWRINNDRETRNKHKTHPVIRRISTRSVAYNVLGDKKFKRAKSLANELSPNEFNRYNYDAEINIWQLTHTHTHTTFFFTQQRQDRATRETMWIILYIYIYILIVACDTKKTTNKISVPYIYRHAFLYLDEQREVWVDIYFFFLPETSLVSKRN